MVAIHSLCNKYYQCQDEDECNTIAQWIQQKFLFPNCVGFIDGALNPFTYEPQTEDAADYSGCKYGYSLSTLLVCDDIHHITYYVVGDWAVHTTTEYSATATCFETLPNISPIGSTYLVIQLMNATLLLLVCTRNHRKCSTWLYRSHRLNLNM